MILKTMPAKHKWLEIGKVKKSKNIFTKSV
jgi:hypothetical protein